MPLGGTQDGRQVPQSSSELEESSQPITVFHTVNQVVDYGPSIRVSEADESDMEVSI